MNHNIYPAPEVRSVESVKLIIANSVGEYLVLIRSKADRNRPGTADLAGGGVDPGESPLQAGFREADEELGLKLRAEQIKGMFCLEAISFFHHINSRHFIVVEVDGTPDIKLNPAEHSAEGWYTRSEAYGLLVHPPLGEGFAVGTGMRELARV